MGCEGHLIKSWVFDGGRYPGPRSLSTGALHEIRGTTVSTCRSTIAPDVWMCVSGCENIQVRRL